tara:strand:+ start:760 stop:906 length:147 start_codon:yes stop_codon:yes gene_type:complete
LDRINNKLGIKLFVGNKKYNETVTIKNFFVIHLFGLGINYKKTEDIFT